jgi:hypothetical protein
MKIYEQLVIYKIAEENYIITFWRQMLCQFQQNQIFYDKKELL